MTARAEHVGSLLRPPYLLDARRELADGRLGPAAFKVVEDRAVLEVLALQDEVGCPVVTDGELRRESFQSELTDACDGFTGVDINAWLWGAWHSDVAGDLTIERPPDLAVVDRVRPRRRLAAEEFTFLRAHTGGVVRPGSAWPHAEGGSPPLRASRVAKVTLPSPSLFANLWSPERSGGAYPRFDGFMADVTDILRDEVRELVRLGCTYIQLDAPHYPLLVDPTWRAFYEARGWPADRWLSYGIELDNAVIEAGRPATFGFHLCRGNQRSRWLVAGGYEAIADRVFGGIRADRLLLEYDDERSGSFDPLRLVPEDRVVVLGLVTTKRPDLESEADLESRLRAAGELIGLDRLALGTQCGFATSLGGNLLDVEDERRKLATIVRVAERVFGGASWKG